MYTYDQKSGLFLRPDGSVIATCYSGNGTGRNNPLWNNVKNHGPISRDIYLMIHYEGRHPKLGPDVIQLSPKISLLNKRGDFWIHGDNENHDASEGCIVMFNKGRVEIDRALAVDNLLEVM